MSTLSALQRRRATPVATGVQLRRVGPRDARVASDSGAPMQLSTGLVAHETNH